MVSTPFSSLVHWFLDRRVLERLRVLSHQANRLWQSCWLPTSMKRQRMPKENGRMGNYNGGMDGLMKVFAGGDVEIKSCGVVWSLSEFDLNPIALGRHMYLIHFVSLASRVTIPVRCTPHGSS
jgi:hypothetical protein